MNPVKVNDTTYEVTLPRGDKVEIGDRDDIDFKPHLKLNRWDGECFVKVGLPTTRKEDPVIEGEKVKWVEQDIEAHFYALEPTTVEGFNQNELGGFEFEIILKRKPQSNQIVLDIEMQGLKYHYQPPLTPEEITEGAVRPENMVGSYAVYHQSRGNMHTSEADAERYQCGKAFHIYRPKTTDANGDWVWAELNIDEKAGTLIVTIDQGFLDKAVYPVSVDPTFGYETIGGTQSFSTSKDLYLTQFQTGVAGTGVSISKYCRLYTTYGKPFKLCIYEDDSDEPGDYLATTGEIAEAPTSWDWVTENLTTSPSLAASTDYWLGTFADNGMHEYRYDAGAATRYKATGAYPTYPDPAGTGFTAVDRKISVYCTYTEGGGPTEKSSSDTGSGAEAKATGNPVATLTKTETGAGADVLSQAQAILDAAETGSGLDACVSLQTPAAKSSSDAGSGVEGTPVPSAELVGSETGSGIEVLIARLLAALDTGSSAEASSVETDGQLKDLFATETAEGSDCLIAKKEMPTKGGGMKLWT